MIVRRTYVRQFSLGWASQPHNLRHDTNVWQSSSKFQIIINQNRNLEPYKGERFWHGSSVSLFLNIMQNFCFNIWFLARKKENKFSLL